MRSTSAVLSAKKKLLIYVPVPRGSNRGNWITAIRWAGIFRELQHDVTIVDPSEFGPDSVAEFDVLIALHARRSSEAIKAFKSISTHKPLVVALTGTDLHGDLHSNSIRAETVLDSLELADRIVLLEPEGINLLPVRLRGKSLVILQSAVPVEQPQSRNKEIFEVTVLGHLRAVKDPFLVARASRLLPIDSKIRIVHIGEALSLQMKALADAESASNERYRWLGPVSHIEAQNILARSRLTVMTSLYEGAPSVISEAVVNDVAVLSTRIHASIGLLGADYPGLFEVGDERRLADLLWQAESDSSFYDSLIAAIGNQKDRFAPKLEKQNLKILLDQLTT